METKSIKVSEKAHKELKLRSAKTTQTVIKIVDDWLFQKKIKEAVEQ